jgi:phosphomannomutase
LANLRQSLGYTPVELGFGTSGLRALVKDMTDLECYINTAGFLAFVNEHEGVQPGDEVYVAGDLRDSTPRIMRAVVKAVRDGGYEPVYLGLIPTPAISLYGFLHGKASIMVTGSHIPADRNGIKFIKPHDEALKPDEPAIKAAVAAARARIYALEAEAAGFDAQGMLSSAAELPEELKDARQLYSKRFTETFEGQPLKGKKVLMYQHSAVGRDLIVELLEALGADAVPVGRSNVFIPIDSENVKDEQLEYFRELARQHEGLFAICSTDGDSDRPFVIDEHGEFHRGDMLGVVVAQWLGADFAAYPVSASDAADSWLGAHGVEVRHTKIGSPYVIAAMKAGEAEGMRRVVSWEVNGGFLTQSELEINGHKLHPLPTRDAFFPILVALLAAIGAGKTVAELFAELPQRFTQAGLINNFPVEVSKEMLRRFSTDDSETRAELEKFFSKERGFGAITKINGLDGVRIYFDNGDIAHLRPSGNAPQLRIYSVAGTQERADEIADLALAEPDGIFREMQKSVG